jgi:hypothetical protein
MKFTMFLFVQQFGFPTQFIQCIRRLFFHNQVQVNINGFFTEDILQTRGLRQGNHLSSLLFNIALEPLLLSIHNDPHYIDYILHTPNSNVVIKCLAYADDICALISNPHDFQLLQGHMQQYCQVSNTRFNVHKTEAISLNGTATSKWESLL